MDRKVDMQHTMRPALVDNSLSPHGGRLIERVTTPQELKAHWPNGLAALPSLAVRDQIARECVNIAYGFLAPGGLHGPGRWMPWPSMTLASGYIWSMPIVFDLSQAELDQLRVKPGDALLLTYQEQPMAVLEVTEIYSIRFLARQIYGTADHAHPAWRTLAYQDRFLAGPITWLTRPHQSAIRSLLADPAPAAPGVCWARLGQGGRLPDPQCTTRRP